MKVLQPLKPGDVWVFQTVRYINGIPIDSTLDTTIVLARTTFGGTPAYAVKLGSSDTVYKYYDSSGSELWGMRGASIYGPAYNDRILWYPLPSGDSVSLFDSTLSTDGLRLRRSETYRGLSVIPGPDGRRRLCYWFTLRSYFTIEGESEQLESSEDVYVEPFVGTIYEVGYYANGSINFTSSLQSYVVF